MSVNRCLFHKTPVLGISLLRFGFVFRLSSGGRRWIEKMAANRQKVTVFGSLYPKGLA
jgi:hypothetical protein